MLNLTDMQRKVRSWLKYWINPEKNKKIDSSIDSLNIANLHYLAMITMCIEVVVLLLYVTNSKEDPFGSGLFSTLSVLYCIAVCIVGGILTARIMKKHENGEEYHHRKITLLIGSFYLALCAWGMLVSGRHYAFHEQMVTFYAIEFCFVTFLAFKPMMGVPLIVGTFGGFYVILRLIDGAAQLQSINYFVFLVLAAVACVFRYRSQVNSLERQMEVQELNTILEETAMHDSLTGLKNRHSLREDFRDYEGMPIFVVMADIDYFKQINDRYGHLIGDEVMKRIAYTLMDVFSTEHCYRYGGDEFLMLLPGENDDSFAEKMTQWQGAVDAIEIDKIQEKIKCSSGYMYGTAEDDADLRYLIQQADGRLYMAKGKRTEQRLNTDIDDA